MTFTRERRIDRLKADFIATVSHELRTPVTPIKGYADLLLRRGDVMAPEKRASCLQLIIERADHLARLVEDLLLTSRISHSEDVVPTVEVTTVALRALVDSVLKNFTDAAGRFVVDDCGSDHVR